MSAQVYLDTSALVKLFVEEAGSGDVAALMKDTEYQAASIVTEAELPAALARAVRVGILTAQEGQKALRAWERVRDDMMWIQLPQTLAEQAGRLAWLDGLRGYDAVHLATALWLQANLGEALVVATFDRELWQAAGRHGLGVFPSTLS